MNLNVISVGFLIRELWELIIASALKVSVEKQFFQIVSGNVVHSRKTIYFSNLFLKRWELLLAKLILFWQDHQFGLKQLSKLDWTKIFRLRAGRFSAQSVLTNEKRPNSLMYLIKLKYLL